jgi:hypothetical protein
MQTTGIEVVENGMERFWNQADIGQWCLVPEFYDPKSSIPLG